MAGTGGSAEQEIEGGGDDLGSQDLGEERVTMIAGGLESVDAALAALEQAGGGRAGLGPGDSGVDQVACLQRGFDPKSEEGMGRLLGGS